MAIGATGACGAMRLIEKLRSVPSICRIEGGGWFSIALVGNELADKVLWHTKTRHFLRKCRVDMTRNV